MNSDTLYELRNIKRIVSINNTILNIERLSIADGSITAVVGQNGAGKSTLLKIMAFLSKPDEGEIVFKGEPVSSGDLFKLRRAVTMVGQSPLLFRGTVFKNVAYGLRVRNIPENEWPSLVSEALAMVDIAGYEDRSVKGLSGGEVQRVAIARALVFKPQVVLLDEPTAGVDATRVEIVEALIRDVNKRSGVSVIFSTHQLAQAHRLTDNVVHIVAGKISEEGIDNIFVGHIENENGRNILHTRNGLKIIVAADCAGFGRFTVPASSIDVVTKSENTKLDNRIEGTVTRLEIRGEKIRIRIDGEIILRAEVEQHRLKEMRIMPGDSVTAAFSPEAVRGLD